MPLLHTFKDVRYGDQGEPANKRVRRKMVGIEPGKSIGSVNINSKDEPTAGASTQAPSAVKTAVKKPTRHYLRLRRRPRRPRLTPTNYTLARMRRMPMT